MQPPFQQTCLPHTSPSKWQWAVLYSLLLPIHVCMLVRRHRLTLLLDVATCDARLVGGVDHHRLPDDATKTESRAQRKNLYQDIGVRWVSMAFTRMETVPVVPEKGDLVVHVECAAK